MKLTKEILTKLIKEQMEEFGLKKTRGKDWYRIAMMVGDANEKGIVEDIGRKQQHGITFHEFAGNSEEYVVITLQDFERLLGKETS